MTFNTDVRRAIRDSAACDITLKANQTDRDRVVKEKIAAVCRAKWKKVKIDVKIADQQPDPVLANTIPTARSTSELEPCYT